MTREARIMEYVRGLGYPVPAIDEISDDGLDMVMERIEGLDMVATMSKRPWTIPRQGRVLAELHVQLHELSAPDWLHEAPVGRGNRLVHLDLHPLNVIVSPRGPRGDRLDECGARVTPSRTSRWHGSSWPRARSRPVG